ncbi:uncharacterized protein LOC131949392 [Physella acuta]|uniref:uncharacterized protein LOC131949392 n=1 Tax=Physella acuta TaxID=109671 RepID=UPI0027DD534D|nr:uncharacterized protein LOC131949392 [Physella acuta]
MDVRLRNETVRPVWPFSLNGSPAAYPSEQLKDIIVWDSLFDTLTFALDVWLCLFICLFGVVTNVLSIRVFLKMGFKDTVNVTMTTIAFWDLVRVLAGGLNRMYGPIGLFSPALGKSWQNIGTTSLTYLQIISGNVSFVLGGGGYVAVERCLCVIAPFKVKSLVTKERAIMACIILSLVVFGTLSTSFFIFECKWIYIKDLNTTIAVYDYSGIYKRYLGPSYWSAVKSLNTAYPIIVFFIIVISTVIIAYQLNSSYSFKKQNLTAKSGSLTTPQEAKQTCKEKQVVRMLLVVIAVYIINLAPRVAQYLAMMIQPEYNVLKFYNNLYWTNIYIISTIDFINASIHLFIFYNMSSKFKVTFLKLLSNKA